MKLNKNLLYILFFTFLVIFSSCSDDDNPIKSKEETIIVSKNLIETLSKNNIKSLTDLLKVIFPDSDLEIEPKFDVEIYKIEYYSKGKKITPIVCSGIICVPKSNEEMRGITSWQHSSIISNSEIPSNKGNFNLNYYEPVITASIGYISTSYDYLGLGSSQTEIQPYHIYSYSAEDWLQFLNATNEFISQNSISTNKDLWILGYSQGGYNAVSAMKKWETENHNFFNLKEVYSGAGAYSLTELFNKIIKQNEYSLIHLTHLFVRAYNYYYDLNLNYSEIYLPEFQNIDIFFDGSKTSEEINEILPEKFDELFTEKFISEIKNQSGIFYNKLSENNLTKHFIPKHKLYMFHSNSDDYIPVSIADSAYETYKNSAGNVELIKSKKSLNHQETYFEFAQFVFNKLQ